MILGALLLVTAPFAVRAADSLPPDKATVAQWKKAAENGDAQAQVDLARYLADPNGDGYDEDSAAKWYRAGALKGDAGAQYELGVFLLGLHRFIDPRSLVDDGERREAEAKKEALRKEALKSLKLASVQNHVKAMLELGDLYLNEGGIVGGTSPAESLKWYKKAAELGSGFGQFKLAIIYEHGSSDVPKDEAQAFQWMLKAAKAGEGYARWMIGNYYVDGVGTKVDLDEAEKWWRGLADEKNVQADKNLEYHITSAHGSLESLAKKRAAMAQAQAPGKPAMPPTAAPAAGKEPLTADDLKALLQVGLASREILSVLTERGYAGATDAAGLAALRKAGADAELLLAVKKASKP